MRKSIWLVLASALFGALISTQASAAEKQLVIYMQCGGTQGDGATLARTNGARAAAAVNNVKLIEQYSKWDQQTMIDQFKQALAAKPDGIAIMGHPGEPAFAALVDQAEKDGIIITSGNNPLPGLEAKYQSKGFGYAGADLYQGGFLTGQAMVKAGGLKAGDKALVYDIWHQEGRSQSPQGITDALTAAGVIVDKLDVSNDVDTDSSLAIPISKPSEPSMATSPRSCRRCSRRLGRNPATSSAAASICPPLQLTPSKVAGSARASIRCSTCKASTRSNRSSGPRTTRFQVFTSIPESGRLPRRTSQQSRLSSSRASGDSVSRRPRCVTAGASVFADFSLACNSDRIRYI